MKLLANENIPIDAVSALRDSGHDVVWISTECPSVSDDEVLEMAEEEGRILLTFDKDFGELAFKIGLPASVGIILLRIPMSPADFVGRFIVDVLASRTDWAGHFAVVEIDRIRMRRLPREIV